VHEALGDARGALTLLRVPAQADLVRRDEAELRGDEDAVQGDEQEANGECDGGVDGWLSNERVNGPLILWPWIRCRAVLFEPEAVALRYEPPRATIDTHRELGWVRRMWPIVRAHGRGFTLALVAGVIALVAQIAVPGVLRSGIDRALGDGDSGEHAAIAPYVWALVGLAAIRFAFGGLYRYGLFRTAYRFETDLRALVYDKLTQLSFSYFDRTQSGQVISRANSDIRSIQLLLAFGPLVILSGLTFLMAFAFMLRIHVLLTLVALSTMPFVYLSGVSLRKRVFPLSWVVQARTADVATIVDENVNGIRVVMSHAAEERQIRNLARAAQRLRWASVETARQRAHWTPLIEALPRLGAALVLLYGGLLAIDGTVSIGTLVAFNAYVILLQTPFRMFGFLLIQAQRASASAQRIFEILDEEPEIVDRPGAIVLTVARGDVELRNVSFRYPSVGDDGPLVLDGLSLHVAPGERLAIVGRTGSGKSTIARLLPRFYDVDAGAVLIDGHDVRDVALTSLRHHVGMVLDEPFLFSVSLRDNIAYGRPDASFDEVVAAAKAAQAHDFIMRLPEGYDTVVGERGYTLSGGQRQRIAIARTLLVNPRILVLDDATSAIDVTTEEAIHEALETLMTGRTTIVIAHRLSTIALADRVVLLEDGRVAAAGTHAELLATEPRYADVLANADDARTDDDEDVA
jgi:ATP-binding cassette subfamily B protein